MKEFVVWEKEVVERGYIVKADSAEDAVKKFRNAGSGKYFEEYDESILEYEISDVIEMED